MKKPSNATKSVYTSFVTTPDIFAAIQKAAAQEDRSQSWIIGKAVETYLRKLGVLKKTAGH